VRSYWSAKQADYDENAAAPSEQLRSRSLPTMRRAN
jgi:hypothetical protein